MSAPLAELLAPYRTITVVGLAKNAGKTTVINHLLEHMHGRVGIASLGLDGEARDQLTGLHKPRVWPPADALVATTTGLVDVHAVRVVERLPYRTAVGSVLVVEPPSDTPVTVSGPTRLDELDATVEALHAAGARRVLLEGALGRLGPAAPSRAEAVVLAAGASLANSRDDYAVRLRLALAALDLPVSDVAAGLEIEHAAGYERETAARIAEAGVGLVELRGALTGPLLEQLLRLGAQVRLCVADATRVLARPQQVARAGRAGVETVVRAGLAIVAVTASPFHPDVHFTADETFVIAVAAVDGRWPVYDVVSGRMVP